MSFCMAKTGFSLFLDCVEFSKISHIHSSFQTGTSFCCLEIKMEIECSSHMFCLGSGCRLLNETFDVTAASVCNGCVLGAVGAAILCPSVLL